VGTIRDRNSKMEDLVLRLAITFENRGRCKIGDAALYVIYRVASCVLVCCYPANLGDVLVRGEWLLAVLGDVLTATDAGRLARVMGVLEEAAQRLPVLILICHPERYCGLAGANFVYPEAIVREDIRDNWKQYQAEYLRRNMR